MFSFDTGLDLVHDLQNVFALHVLLPRFLKMRLQGSQSSSFPVYESAIDIEGEEFEVGKFGHVGWLGRKDGLLNDAIVVYVQCADEDGLKRCGLFRWMTGAWCWRNKYIFITYALVELLGATHLVQMTLAGLHSR